MSMNTLSAITLSVIMSISACTNHDTPQQAPQEQKKQERRSTDWEYPDWDPKSPPATDKQ